MTENVETAWTYEQFIIHLLKNSGYVCTINFIEKVYSDKLIDYDWYCYLLGIANDCRIK